MGSISYALGKNGKVSYSHVPGTKEKKLIVVKSEHIGGHKIVSRLGKVKSKKFYENPQKSIKSMKKKAIELGANGIIKRPLHNYINTNLI